MHTPKLAQDAVTSAFHEQSQGNHGTLCQQTGAQDDLPFSASITSGAAAAAITMARISTCRLSLDARSCAESHLRYGLFLPLLSLLLTPLLSLHGLLLLGSSSSLRATQPLTPHLAALFKG